ncbi:hypothetical protein [Sphingopyxis sp.]|jgi:hypothetical protein|uniref:hypothetical protein n=1 Tax=Sphingopyxis sp. TaxID=1908224 RepID=UPI003F7028DE
MGVAWLFIGITWLACTAVTLLFASLIDRFAMRRRWGRTPRALWLALLAGHALNLLLFWNPFTLDPHRWLLYAGTAVAAGLLLWPAARRRR